MKFFSFLSLLIFLSCSPKEWSGTVRYEVVGTTTDTAIHYDNHYNTSIVNSTTIPWNSGNISVDAHDDSPFCAYIKAINNTSNNTTLDVYIYIDDILKTHKTGSGANCEVIATYMVEAN
jgi:hypothetical protein